MKRRTLEVTALAVAVAAGILLLLRLGGVLPRKAPVAKVDAAASLRPYRALLASPDTLRDPDVLLFGVSHPALPRDFAALEQTESLLGAALPIVSFTIQWGDDPEQRFPWEGLRRVSNRGSVPMITWEPWVTNFASTTLNELPPRGEREYRSLAAIARGSYDFYVREWAEQAARFGRPLFLRFAPEPNDPHRHPWGPQNGNRPEDFLAAWRHLHQVFADHNARNVLWVWSPQASVPFFDYYYPGGDFVDWTGVAVLNYGTTATWSRWWGLAEVLEKPYPILAAMGKPIMITEFGTVRRGGDAAGWYRDAFAVLPVDFKRIHAVILYNSTDRGASFTLTDSDTTSVIAAEIRKRLFRASDANR